MPETTPMANETAKIFVQKRASRCRCSRPVMRQRTSSVAMKAASPIVKLGKMMWNVIVNANWMRAKQDGIEFHGAGFVFLVCDCRAHCGAVRRPRRERRAAAGGPRVTSCA